MAKKKSRKMSPEERAAWDAHLDERIRQLREREARGMAELAARRARSGEPGSASRDA
jgi:hypothetical protein